MYPHNWGKPGRTPSISTTLSPTKTSWPHFRVAGSTCFRNQNFCVLGPSGAYPWLCCNMLQLLPSTSVMLAFPAPTWRHPLHELVSYFHPPWTAESTHPGGTPQWPERPGPSHVKSKKMNTHCSICKTKSATMKPVPNHTENLASWRHFGDSLLIHLFQPIHILFYTGCIQSICSNTCQTHCVKA